MTLLWLLVGLNSILTILLCILMAGVLRYLSGIGARLEVTAPRISRLEKGDRFPRFELASLGDHMTLPSGILVGSGVPALVVLVNDTCSACDVLTKQIGELVSRPGGLRAMGWRVILIWVGEPDVAQGKVSGLPEDEYLTCLMDRDGKLTGDLLISGFPTGFAVDGSGELIDQSGNPGPNWLYLTLGVPGPGRSLEDRAPRPMMLSRG